MICQPTEVYIIIVCHLRWQDSDTVGQDSFSTVFRSGISLLGNLTEVVILLQK